jgi:hypothetical protein
MHRFACSENDGVGARATDIGRDHVFAFCLHYYFGGMREVSMVGGHSEI